jgi:Uma2 family endonuclease
MRDRNIVSDETGLLTAEELSWLPDDGYRYELVDGRLVKMPPPKPRHGEVAANLAPLYQFVRARGLGEVFLSEVGFRLASNPDTVRAPDVAFIRRARVPTAGLPVSYWPGAPDLAVEVVSPDDRMSDVRAKAAEWLRYGASLVWVVDPSRRVVIEFRSGQNPVTLDASQALDGHDVVPGFRLGVRDLFE